MIFSKEQEEIFKYVEKGPFNMIIQAVAGAGKTTTLVECVKRISEEKSILLLAHNRSTRDTLKERIGDKPNVKIYTIHGLAWRMFNEHFETVPEIFEDKYRDYVNKNIGTLASNEYKALSRAKKMNYKANVFNLIDKARLNLKQSEKEIRKLAVKKYGISLVADECRFVADVLKEGMQTLDKVDYCDLLCMPFEHGYFTKKYLSDIIMLDEAQDASPAQQDIIKRCFKRETRLFAFGDDDQTINSWCGSDSESFEHLHDANEFRRPAVDFPLTTNYRCGKNIIAYAKQYTDKDIKARDGAQDGEIRFNVSLNEAKNGDMILCRNTAPLMDVYRICVANGKKVYFRGEELGKNLIFDADCEDGDTIEEIIRNMKVRLISLWNMLTYGGSVDEKEAMMNPSVISLLDTIKTMESLPKTVEKRADLERFVKDVFSDEGKDGIQLSTIHRAKGLEADNVFVVCPSLIPSRLSRLDWQIREERHLQYVMCTRPKETLNFVSEKEVAPFIAFSKANTLHSELNKIRDEVESLL